MGGTSRQGGRTRLRLGDIVQDPPDSVYHHLRLIPLDEMPAALYDTPPSFSVRYAQKRIVMQWAA